MLRYVHGNRRLIWGREPRTATSTFTLLLNSDLYRPMDTHMMYESVNMVLNVHRNHEAY